MDPGSSPGASTKQLKTKILSVKSSGDVIAGALAVLLVDFVLRTDVSGDSNKPLS